MSFLLKVSSIVFALGCLWFSAVPTLAGTCTFRCQMRNASSAAVGAPFSVGPTAASDQPQCGTMCTESCSHSLTPAITAAQPMVTSIICVDGSAAYVDATPPTEAPRFVCGCDCVNTGGGAAINIPSAQTCARALASDPACVTACTALCLAGTTAPDTRVHAGATLSTGGASCAVASSSATPPADTPATGATGGSSVAPPTNANREAVPLQLSQPIDGVSVVSDFGNYIAVVYRYAIGLAGTAAVIMIVYGGFLYLLGSATSDVGKGKQIIQDAIIGLLLVLGAYTILATVNPNTLNLKMPDLQRIAAVALPAPPAPPDIVNHVTQDCNEDANCGPGRVCLLHNASGSITEGLRNMATHGAVGAGAGTVVAGPGVGTALGTAAGVAHGAAQDVSVSCGSASCGRCTGGASGERCRCVGPGCGVDRAHWSGGPVNNNFQITANIDYPCRAGLRCAAVAESIQGDSEYVCTGGAFSVCNVHRDPHVECTGTGDDWNYCWQRDDSSSNLVQGICLYGTWRDDAYRAGTGSVNMADADRGNCTGIIDASARSSTTQKCRAGAGVVCTATDSSFSTPFAGTNAMYSSGHVPSGLDRFNFFRKGCRKNIGATCTADEECPAKCVGGTCTGFCFVTVANLTSEARTLLQSARLFSGLHNIPEEFPAPNFLESACSSGCDETTTWSFIHTYLDSVWDNTPGDIVAKTTNYIDALRAMGGFKDEQFDHSACFPRRATGQKCDFPFQCRSNTCNRLGEVDIRVAPATLNAPMDMNVGAGTCG